MASAPGMSNMNANDLFLCAPSLTIEIKPKGTYILRDGVRFRGDHNTLRILDVFSRPIRMQDAVTELKSWTPGFAAFTQMMNQVMSLVSSGVIVNQTGQMPVLESDIGAIRFAARPYPNAKRPRAYASLSGRHSADGHRSRRSGRYWYWHRYPRCYGCRGGRASCLCY